jgi:tRNA pseudouridine55 synthase
MPIDGLLVIDKPAGLTSHDVVARVRLLLGVRRVGHGGTLDPDATGVLLVAVGQATRFFPYLSKEDKVYEGAIRLGFATDTYDASGRPSMEESRDFPGHEDLVGAMKNFEGRILQTPPPYSAKKIGGKPAYKLARAHKEFTLKPSVVTVEWFRLRDYRPPLAVFEAKCSAGTYVRSLAHDLGQRLGCGAHLDALRRTSVGPYALGDAVSLVALEEAGGKGEAAALILPLERLLPGVPAVAVFPEAEMLVRNGAALGPAHLGPSAPDAPPFPREACVLRLFGESGKLLALARPSPDGESLHPFLVIS